MSGTKLLEEEFDIAPNKKPEEPEMPPKKISQAQIDEAVTMATKIAQALTEVTDLDDHENEMKRLGLIGEEVMKDLLELGMGVEVQDAAPILGVYHNIYKTVLQAMDKITERKHERIKLQIENEKVELKREELQIQREKEVNKKEALERKTPAVEAKGGVTAEKAPDVAVNPGMSRADLLANLTKLRDDEEAVAEEIATETPAAQ